MRRLYHDPARGTGAVPQLPAGRGRDAAELEGALARRQRLRRLHAQPAGELRASEREREREREGGREGERGRERGRESVGLLSTTTERGIKPRNYKK